MRRRLADISITTALVVLVLQVMGLTPAGPPRVASASDVGISTRNGGPVVGGYDELWEALTFCQPEGDDNLTGPDSRFDMTGNPVELRKGFFRNERVNTQWHDHRVKYHFLVAQKIHGNNASLAMIAMPPVVTAWRVTGHMHGK